jgi:hypothetical protein
MFLVSHLLSLSDTGYPIKAHVSALIGGAKDRGSIKFSLDENDQEYELECTVCRYKITYANNMHDFSDNGILIVAKFLLHSF